MKATEAARAIIGRLLLAGGATTRRVVGRMQDNSTDRPSFYNCQMIIPTWDSQHRHIEPGIRVVPMCSMTIGESGSIQGVILGPLRRPGSGGSRGDRSPARD